MNKKCQRSFYKYLLRNGLMMLFTILIIVAVLLMLLIDDFSHRELRSANKSAFENACQQLETQFSLVNRIGQKIEKDQALMFPAILDDPSGIYANKAIQRYGYAIDALLNYFLYIDVEGVEIDSLYSPWGTYQKKYFETLYTGPNGNVSFDQLEPALLQAQHHTLGALYSDADELQALYYIYPLKQSSKYQSSLCFLLNYQQIFSDLNGKYTGCSTTRLMLTWEDGGVLFEDGAIVKTSALPEASADEMRFSYASNFLPITFTVDMVCEGLFVNIRVLSFTLVLFALVGLLGMLLVWRNSLRSYRPIQSLLDDLYSAPAQTTGSAYGREFDELQSIHEIIQTSRQHCLSLESDLASKTAILRDNLLEYLVFGNPDGITSDEIERLLGTRQKQYCIGCVMIDRVYQYDRRFMLSDQIYCEEYIQNQLQALSDGQIDMHMTRFQSNKAAAFLMIFSENVSHEDCRQRLALFQNQVAERLPLTVSVVLSPTFDALDNLRMRYQAVRKAANFRILLGVNVLIDTVNSPVWPVVEGEIVETAQLLEAVRSGRTALASELTQRLLRQKCKEADLSSLLAAYYQLRCQLRVLAEQEQLLGYVDFDADSDPVSTLQEAHEKLCILNGQLIHAMEQAQHDSGFQICRSIQGYILANYGDNQLSVAALSKQFNLPQQQLSQLYREKCGEYPSATLERIRMQKAKELLAESRMTVNEIVLAIGYTDASNFGRKFKSQEGVTPLQYRKQHSAV